MDGTFVKQGNFSYRFGIVESPETLKFVGVADGAVPGENWRDYDKSPIRGIIEPAVGIRLWQNETHKDGIWMSGSLAESVDGLPEGVVGIDTGWDKFLILTVRRDTVDEIYDDEHFNWAHYESWSRLPVDIYELSPNAPGADRGFCTKNNGSTSLIEIYPAELRAGVPEMCFYYPFPVK